MKNLSTRRMVLSGLFLALGLILPTAAGHIPNLGRALLPMHIPVLLCGFVCGWPYGLAIGFITPILGSILSAMPPMYPTAVAMAFELAFYGFAAGLLFKLLPRKAIYTYVTLVAAMVGGRIVWGIASLVLIGLGGDAFTFNMFISGAVVNAIPGIIIQIVLIPIIIIYLEKAKLLES